MGLLRRKPQSNMASTIVKGCEVYVALVQQYLRNFAERNLVGFIEALQNERLEERDLQVFLPLRKASSHDTPLEGVGPEKAPPLVLIRVEGFELFHPQSQLQW